MMKQIIKAFLNGIFFSLGALCFIFSIQAFNNWNNVASVENGTLMTAEIWNNTMNTLTGNIQNLENRLDSLFPAVTPATSAKVTYNDKGLVTGGASLVESDIPNLTTTKITSGVFPVARLGTGSPTSSNFLRGDGTWQSVSVSGMSACSGTAHMTVLFQRSCSCSGFELKQCRNGTWGTISVNCNDYC